MTNTKDDWAEMDWADELFFSLKHTSTHESFRKDYTEAFRKIRADGEKIGELRGRIKGLREAANLLDVREKTSRNSYKLSIGAGLFSTEVRILYTRADKLEKGET
jgi:predicted transposase YdaD